MPEVDTRPDDAAIHLIIPLSWIEPNIFQIRARAQAAGQLEQFRAAWLQDKICQTSASGMLLHDWLPAFLLLMVYRPASFVFNRTKSGKNGGHPRRA